MREFEQFLITLQNSTASPHELALFATHQGSLWNRELMVCGRAINGGNDRERLAPGEALPCSASAAELSARFDILTDRTSLAWVAEWWQRREKGEYNTARSAFWRVTREVVNDASIHASATETDWSSYLAWTNLYRVAPFRAGNPNHVLQRQQRELCVALLARDVANLAPKRLLVLAGKDWAHDFLPSEVMEWRDTAGGLVQGSGVWTQPGGSRVAVVVARHPQGKPQRKLVDGLLDAFSELA